MAPLVEPLEQRLALTTISLNGPGDLVIQSLSFANDELSIHADGPNNQFVISDPGQTLNTSIPGATGSGTNQVFLPFSSIPVAKQLIVETTDGNDVIRLTASIGTAFSLAPVLDGGDGFDSIELNAAISVPTDDVAVLFLSEDIRLGGDITTAGGKITFQGDVFVTHDVDLLTDGTTDGDVEFFGRVDSSAGPSFYTLISTPLNYEQAQMQAANDVPGGHLVTIRTAAEQGDVQAVAGTNSVWLGASDRDVEGQWFWEAGPDFGVQFWEGDGTTGNAVGSEFSNWFPGEPDNSDGTAEGDAAFLDGSDFQGRWRDGDVLVARPYIVEAPSLFMLSVSAGGALVKLQGQVGNFLPLRSLTVNAGQAELNGGSVRTAGSQTFNSTVSLMGPTQLVAEEVNFGGGANSVFGSSALALAPIKNDAPITVGAAADAGPASFDITDTDIASLTNSLSKVAIGQFSVSGSEASGFQSRSVGPVTVTSATFVSPVSISGGSISITGLNVGTHTAELTAVIGAITDGGNAAADVTANELMLDSFGGVGTSSDAIDTTVGSLAARASDHGGVFVANVGSLAIGLSSAPGGAFANNDTIAISSTGAMTVIQSIVSQGGDVLLTASNGILIDGVPVDTHGIVTPGGDFTANADSDGDGTGTFSITSTAEFVDWTTTSQGVFADGTTVDITTTSLATATAQVNASDTRFSDGNIYSPAQASGDIVETHFSGADESVTFSFSTMRFGVFLHFDGVQYQGMPFNPATDNPVSLYTSDRIASKVSGDASWKIDISTASIQQLSGDELADQDGTVRFEEELSSLSFTRVADGVSPGNDNTVNVQLGLIRQGGLFTGGGAVVIRSADVQLEGFVNAGSGLVSLIPSGTNRTVDLGATGGSGQFILTDAELDSISTEGGIVVGNASTGDITINAAVTRPLPTNLILTVANNKDIKFVGSNASLMTADGNVSLTTGGTGTIRSGDAANDIVAAIVSVTAGSGNIGANGNPLTLDADSLNSNSTASSNQFFSTSEELLIGSLGLSSGSGEIQFAGGLFKLVGSDQINDASRLAILPGATFQLNGFNETIAALNDSGSVVNGSTSAATLTINQVTGTFTFSGTLGGTGTDENNFALTKVGAGTLILTGNNTNAGLTTVGDGTLVVDGSLVSNLSVASGGTLAGTGTIIGSVQVDLGGTVAPGNSPGILNTGDFVLSSGSTLSIEVNGPVPDEQHDQVNVTGTVNLGGATLSTFGTITSIPGQVVVLVNNDDTEVVTGTFAGLAEGATVTINTVNFVISYRGGTGNDVTLTEAGTMVLVGSRFDDALELREATISGSDYLQFVMNGQLIEQRLSAGVVDISILGDEGNDTLTIDYSGSGGFFNKLVNYAGGDPTSGLGDSLILSGGSFTSVTHVFTSASDGTIAIDGSTVVAYSGLEPIFDNLSATDRVFNFGGTAETITLTDASGSEMRIDSTDSESVTFTSPTSSLTINAGAADDTVLVSSVNAGFRATLTINGEAGADTATLDTNLTLGAGTVAGSVLIAAETINLNANISTDLGTNAGAIGFNGAVQLGANVTLDSDSTNGTDASITLNGTIDGGHNLTTISGGAATTFNGAIGGSAALTDLDVTAGTINLNANITTDGGSLTFTGNTVLGVEVIIATEVGNDNAAGSVTFSGGSLSASGANRNLMINTGTNGGNSGGAVTLSAVGNAAGNSVRQLTISALPLGGGLGGDVTFTDSVNLASDGGLFVEGRTILLSTSNSDLTLGGTANVFFSAARNIDLATGSSIQAVDGDVSLEANRYATATSGDFVGIQLDQATIRTTGAGSISLVGRSGDSSALQHGILVGNSSLLEATGAGEIFLFGESRGTSGPENDGILISSNSDILSNSGQIILRGIGGVGSTAEGIGVTDSGITISATSAPVFLLADVIHIGSTQPVISAGSGNVIFVRPITPGTAIGLGTESSSVFSLSDSQLDRLTADALQIGDTDSGSITISDNITRSAATGISLITGGNNSIVFSGSTATLDSNNGDVTLTLNTAGTGAITSGLASKDVRGTSVSLISGSGGIGTPGNPLITDASALDAATSGNAPMFLEEIDSVAIDVAGLSADSGTITLSNGTFRLGGANRVNDNSPLVVTSGAKFQLNGFDESLGSLTGAGSVINGVAPVATLTLNLASDQTFSGVLGGSTSLDNNFGLTKSGSGTLTLDATNSYTGATNISGGTLLINGSVTSDVTVASGATIGGTGTIASGNALVVENGATVAPGTSPGLLSVGSLSLQSGSTFQVELDGNAAGTQYDQIHVTGTSNGLVMIDTNVTLDVTLGFSPTAGDVFVLIDNEGSDAVSGTFDGLSQDAVLTIAGKVFHIVYNFDSGDGNANDVALIVNEPPVIADQSFSASEDATNGAVVGTVIADDAASALTFAITSGNTANAFSIDVTTGEIRVANAAAVDFESNPVFSLNVEVTDDVGATNSATVTINVTNVAPSPPTDSDTAADSVSEGAVNGATVGIDANSSDVHGGSVTFSLTDNAGGRFMIDSASGVVTVLDASLLNFESANSHTITVEASDGANVSTQDFTISVTNVVPSTPNDADTAADSVSEGAISGDLVGIDANSGDVHGGTITFSLADDASGRFTIHPTTGIVRVANASLLDFETATSHLITIQASDGANVSTQDFTIGVTNVAPSTPTDADTAADSVSEGAINGDLVGIDANSGDDHGGAVTFSLTDDAGGRFAIHPSTGVVRVANASLLSFESATSHLITVQASDGSNSTTTDFTIAVTNVAPTSPVDGDNSPNAITEGVAVGDPVGIDANSGDVHGGAVNFSLIDDASGQFAIDATTGVVTVANAALFDFTAPASHTIVVQASDGTSSSTKSFTIGQFGTVPDAPLDVDDHANRIPEGALEGSRVGITLFATAPDGGTVYYQLIDDVSGRFAVDPLTGVVTVKEGRLLEFAVATQHTIRAVAKNAVGVASGEVTFVINVTQVPEDALPLASILPTRVSVVEGDSGPNFIEFLVKLNKPSDETITIDFTTRVGDDLSFQPPEGIGDEIPFATDEPGPWDFFRSTGRLTFDPGVTEQTLRVQIRPDDVPEPNELFFVQLRSPVNVKLAPQQSIATARILDDDSAPQLIVSNTQTLEGDVPGQNELVFNVQLIGEFPPGTDSATTDFVTGNIAIDTAEAGVDYTAASGTLTFTDGSRQQQVRIPIIGDFSDESDKTVSLLFTNPVGLALSRSEVVGTILNDDSTASILVSISPTVFKVREDNSGSQQVPFVVTLIGKPADTVTVNYATADGTATAGSDYVPNTGSVTFTSADITSGIIQKLIFVTVKGDTNIEPDETFAITLELPSGSPAGVSINPDLAAGKVVIRNDDQAILTEVGDALALALSDDLTTILGNGPKSNPALLAALRTRALEIIRTQGLTKAIVIILDPVDFVLTDTQGRQSGYTEGTGVVNDIPGTYYSGDGAVELMIVPLPPDGTYNVQLAGLGGDFNASVTILDSNGTSTNILSQSLSDGATSSFSFQVGERATIPVGLGLAARAEAASAIGVVGAFGQFGLRLALAIGQDNAERNGLNLDDANTRNSEWMSWLSTTVRVARRELLEPLWQTLESPLGDLWATGLPLPDGIPAEFVDRFWSQVGQSLTGVPSGIYRLGDMLESLLPKPAPGRNRSTTPRAGEQSQPNRTPETPAVKAKRSSLESPRSTPANGPTGRGSGQQSSPPNKSNTIKDKSAQSETLPPGQQQSSTPRTHWLWFAFKDESSSAKPAPRT